MSVPTDAAILDIMLPDMSGLDVLRRIKSHHDSVATLVLSAYPEKQYGLKLANGQDTLKGKIIRLAHMGYIDQFDVLSGLAGVELVLLEMGYPVEPGRGLAAAQRVLAGAARMEYGATV